MTRSDLYSPPAAARRPHPPGWRGALVAALGVLLLPRVTLAEPASPAGAAPGAAAAVPSGWAPRPIEEALQRAAEVDLRRRPGRSGAPDSAAPLDDAAPAAGDAPALDDEDSEGQGEAPGAAADRLEQLLPSLARIAAEPVRGVESSGFGWRDDPIRHRRRFHRGSDFRAPRGTPVYAAGAGEVLFTGRRRGYGRMIDVRHADGLITRYAHLDRIGVDAGQPVAEGEPIGQVGSTGRATGPHLHFEVRLLGRAVDPQVAVRVGELARTASPGELHLAALALRAEAQESTVSAIDPPRRLAARKAARPARKKARRPNA